MGETTDKMTGGEAHEIQAIKADIEETRAELSETIDEIEERLSPRHLARQAKDTIKEATVGRIGTMMNSATDTARDLADEGRYAAGGMTRHMRENPIPYALIGAGVSWLLLSGRNDRTSSYRRRPMTGGYYDEQWSGAERRIAGEEQSWTEGVGDAASRARQRMGEYSHRAQGSLDRWVRDNPLAFGVAALAVGAAIGLSVPETETENEWMGEARDNLVEKAQDLKDQAVQTVQENISGTNS